MTTTRKTPSRKKPAAKAAKKRAPARNTPPRKKSASRAEIRAALQFALRHNFGLSSRVRELLDSKKQALQALVEGSLPMTKIQEFIQREYGPKIGLKPLASYIQGTFPSRAAKAAAKPRKVAKAPAKKTAKKATRKAASSAKR